jgi:hypothetical protein
MSDYAKYKKNRELLKNNIKIRFTGYNGEDLSHKLSYSYSYNGIPEGWYIKDNKYDSVRNNCYNR